MEARVNYAAVGIFVLILSGALIFGVLWLASGGAARKIYDTYYAHMDESVSGLNLDAPVRYRGVDVGRVRKIELAPKNIEQVRLTLDIERGTPVRVDTVATMRMQGLTGIAYIELAKGHHDSPPLLAKPGEDYPAIRSGPSLLVRLDAAVTSLLTNVNRSSENFNALTDEASRRAIGQALEDLAVVSRSLAARSTEIESGLTNAARSMENAARLTQELSQLVERAQRSADAFDRMTSELTRAGASAADAFDRVGAEARLFATETLPEAQLLVADLRDLTASLRRFSEQLERNPSVLLYGKSTSKPGPGE